MTVVCTRGDYVIAEFEKQYLSVGYKQTVKSIRDNNVKKIYIAKDCEDKMFDFLKNEALNKGIDTVFVETMRELGKMCCIDKGASCAVIKKHN